ncbi:hypothetical protein [Streptomyces sp. NPDC046385]|uniref:hypothetical protein n=1 Tax=Streptomyces sp. NPDC046385 TaxID=3154918 RepID=UPI003407245E
MGRPLQDKLRGRTEEANRLAEWLRTVTNGIPVRTLETRFHYSKAMWSQYRSGSTLIGQDLLDKVVDELVPQDMRGRVRANGHKLLAAALEAAKRPADQPPPPAAPPVRHQPPTPLPEALQLALRLDDARLQQMETMRRLDESEKRCAQLQGLVLFLQSQSVQLAQERDRALDEARETRELQQALDQSEKFRVRAEGQLRRARRAAQEAFELRLAAEAKVVVAQSQIRAGSPQPAAMPQPAADGMDLPPMERIADVLEAADALLDEQDMDLGELRSDLGLAPDFAGGSAPRVIEGEVIVSSTADEEREPGGIVQQTGPNNTVNNPVTRPDTASSPPPTAIADALLNAVTPAHLGRQIEALRKREGVLRWSVGAMLATVNDVLRSADEPAVGAESVRGWLTGDRFPRLDWALMELVVEMGATPQETLEFFHAHRRIHQREADAFENAPPNIRRQDDESFAKAERRAAWLAEGWTKSDQLKERRTAAGAR